MMGSILVLDDEESIRFSFHRFLVAVGHQVTVAESYKKALEKMDEVKFDLIFADIILGDGCGIDILNEVVRRTLKTGVIIMTAYPTQESKDMSFRLNALEYLNKPLCQERLLFIVNTLLEHLMQDTRSAHNRRQGIKINAIFCERRLIMRRVPRIPRFSH